MRVTVDRFLFLEALDGVAWVHDGKSNRLYDGHVLIESKSSQATVDVTMRQDPFSAHAFVDASVERDGSVVLPLSLLRRWVDACNATELTLTADNGEVHIKGGLSWTKQRGPEEALFPRPDHVVSPGEVVPCQALRRLLRCVAFSMAEGEEPRAYVTVVLSGNRLEARAAREHSRACAWTILPGNWPNRSFSWRLTARVTRVLQSDRFADVEGVELATTQRNVCVGVPRLEVVSPVVPALQWHPPGERTVNRCTAARSALVSAVRMLDSTRAATPYAGVSLKTEGDRVVIRFDGASHGESLSRIHARCEGAPAAAIVTFGPLLEAVTSSVGEDLVLSFGSPQDGLLVESETESVAVRAQLTARVSDAPES